jgi:hypothetical protein
VLKPRLTDAELEVAIRALGLDEDEVSYALKMRRFALGGLGLDLHPGQVAWLGVVGARRTDGWGAKWLTVVLASGNQAGKTLALAVFIIYACLGKVSRPRPDDSAPSIRRWMQLPYSFWHFGIAHEVADLVFSDITKLLSGVHEAQPDGCPIQAQMGIIAMWDAKEFGEYRWVRFLPEVGGAEVHFRTTGERSLGQLGQKMHGISFDEAGIEPKLPFLMREVFNMRRIATGGQLLLISTPSEAIGRDFADEWNRGDPENPARKSSYRSIRMSTRSNIGYGLTEDMFERLIEDMDDDTIAQNIDGEFIQPKGLYFNQAAVDAVFDEDLPEAAFPSKMGMYVQGVDPALRFDGSWSIVCRVLPGPEGENALIGVSVNHLKGRQTVPDVIALASIMHDTYAGVTDEFPQGDSSVTTAIDATGFGGKMFKELLQNEIGDVISVEFGGNTQKKRKLLGDLRTVIDKGYLRLPAAGDWQKVRRQLLGYKVEDRKIEQDAVMALACLVAASHRVRPVVEERVLFAPGRINRYTEMSATEKWLSTPYTHAEVLGGR